MASDAELITFASRDAMAARVGDLIASHALCASNAQIAVSGGSTPKALYRSLAGRSLPWKEIDLTLVDERWVPLGHPRSNEAFIRAAFKDVADLKIAGLFNGAQTANEGVDDIAARFEGRAKAFDVVVLGMGDDGHTASWFPHAHGLGHALASDDFVCAVMAKESAVTGTEVERMTLTLSAIRDARLIVLLLAGASKRATFEKALEAGPVDDMPVRAILRARPDMWVCWAP